MQMLLMNPRRRRRKASARRRHGRKARRMTAKQLKYFGPRKRRASSRRSPRRRSRSRSIVVHANPAPRRRRSRRASRRAARRYRRNPISVGGIRASFSSIQGIAVRAATGAVGAVAADVAMAQASRFLPASISARYRADGSMNPAYYGGKAALTIVLGILGTRFAPGRLKGVVSRGVEGALTVQGYEVVRAMLPASLTMGFYNPGRVASGGGVGRVGRVGAYFPANPGMARMRGLRASFPAGSAFSGAGVALADTRVGEGSMQ